MKHNVIWYSFALLFLFILVLTISATGQEIQVNPESIEVELIGGDTVTENITVKWTGSDSIQCFISTNITSNCPENDSEGINVTYSESSPFNLPSNVDYIVEMTIKASIDIMPGIYTITTTFSCEYKEPETPPGNGGNGGWSPPSPPDNIPPIADASSGESYTGNVGEEITFDGSKSFDTDGTIIKWYWDFGDGTSGIGEVANHVYSNPGIYDVILTVIDNKNAIGSYETTTIIQQLDIIDDVNVLFIDDVIQGYLLDEDNDGIYDIFHNNATGSDTEVELLDNGNYLIDSDDDTMWDYEYNPYTNTLNVYGHDLIEEDDETLILVIVIVLGAIILVIVICIYWKRKDKNKKK